MSNVNNLKEIQYKKIGYFCSKTKIDNIHTAERYLNEAMWDEKLAVQNCLKKHNDANNDFMNFFKSKMQKYEANQNINFQKPLPVVNNDINNSENEEKINEKDENFIPLKIPKRVNLVFFLKIKKVSKLILNTKERNKEKQQKYFWSFCVLECSNKKVNN